MFLVVNQVPFPAHAQNSDPILESQIINQCYDQVFEKFKVSYEKITNQPIEVDEALRLKFLVSMIAPTENQTLPKYSAYVIASLAYVGMEEISKTLLKNSKPAITDQIHAIKWKIEAKEIQAWMDEAKAKLPQLENNLKVYEASSTSAQREALLRDPKEIARLQNEFTKTEAYSSKMNGALELFEKNPAAAKALLTRWQIKYWVVQGVLLGAYIISLEVLPEAFGSENNFPASLQSLHDSSSTVEFEQQLCSTHPDVSTLRKNLIQGCKQTLAMDMDMFVAAMRDSTAPEILFALRNLPNPNTKKKTMH